MIRAHIITALIILFAFSCTDKAAEDTDAGMDGNGTSDVDDSDYCEMMPSWPEARDPMESAAAFPEWSFFMKIWPFDILRPDMPDTEIDEALTNAQEAGADTVIFYIEEEHMYGTFVDEGGFEQILEKIRHLTDTAGELDLHTIAYVNGLEVMTRDAFNDDCNATGTATAATEHPGWLTNPMSMMRRSESFFCSGTGFWLIT